MCRCIGAVGGCSACGVITHSRPYPVLLAGRHPVQQTSCFADTPCSLADTLHVHASGLACPAPTNSHPPTHPPSSSSSPRRKDLKNPRKKNRIKFAQASTRRKGQVQGVRPAQGAGYGGEATGIKAKVAKSTRLG